MNLPQHAAQQLDGADPASQVFGIHAILALAGRAAHLEAVGRLTGVADYALDTKDPDEA